MNHRLYPKERYPDGHTRLAFNLNDLGTLRQAMGEYGKALTFCEQALAMRQKLYPKERYPDGHADLGESLSNLGVLFQVMGEYGKALTFCEQALAMRQKLYPKERYPDGHPDLASSLSNLGDLLGAIWECEKALTCYERALAMCLKLYPKERYPDGHPDLARSLNHLGALLQVKWEYERALPYFKEALAMCERLYPVARFPDGHPALATSWRTLGGVLRLRGEYGPARACYDKALAMCRALYPEERYPSGHPNLAMILTDLGILLNEMGKSGQALTHHERALAMRHKLYPRERFPHGHLELATSLHNLGYVYRARGEYGRALTYLEKALAMHQSHLTEFADLAPQSQALALATRSTLTRDTLLSVGAQLAGSEASVYRSVWQAKAAVTRVLQRRHLARLAAASPVARQRWQALLDARRHLARVLAAPGRDAAARAEEARVLTERKERLERELAETLPQLPRQKDLDSSGPDELARRLPAGSAFIDLLRYTHLEQDPKVPGAKGLRTTDRFVAFILAPGQPVRRVELGPAAPIEDATERWRNAIARQQDSPAGQTLCRLVWEPLARHVPAGTRALYLAPDWYLTRLPWAALPADAAGTVLLERYTLAVVPHGPFLLERLLHPGRPAAGAGRVLALGGVRYDADPRPRGGYRYLPGTRAELAQVAALAGRRPVVRLEGDAATAERLARELPGARYAHLATHGFFNRPELIREKQARQRLWKSWEFQPEQATDTGGLALRSPLHFTGLVLAGANQPAGGGSAGAILTGEGLAELPLEKLDLAVLSACETGLGAANFLGEGVFGLQRAFHLAGCRNVVASLWQVPDVATLVLMEQFYQRLWHEKQPLPPAEALRQAQLAVLRDPGLVRRRAEALRAELAKRGVGEAELELRGFGRVLKKLPDGGRVEGGRRSPPLWWASFILSGDGR
jgi:CHAT domain-containing protein